MPVIPSTNRHHLSVSAFPFDGSDEKKEDKGIANFDKDMGEANVYKQIENANKDTPKGATSITNEIFTASSAPTSSASASSYCPRDRFEAVWPGSSKSSDALQPIHQSDQDVVTYDEQLQEDVFLGRQSLQENVYLGQKPSIFQPDMQLKVKNTFLHFDVNIFGSSQMSQSVRRSKHKWSSSPPVVQKGSFHTKYPHMERAHQNGDCKPCAYHAFKPDGCRRADECPFCHLCSRRDIKRKKKERIRVLKHQAQTPQSEVEDGPEP